MSETPVISPGAYLQKRREAAGLGLLQAAANLAALPWAVGRPGSDQIRQLQHRLTAAEEDRQPFTLAQAELVRAVFPFDVGIYLQLVDLHDNGAVAGQALPQLCRSCACSWNDPCEVRVGNRTIGCAWSSDAALCTACRDRVQAIEVLPVEVGREQAQAA